MSKLAEIKDLNAYQLQGIAECGDPDGQESEGALFLLRVRDAVVEKWEYAQANGEEVEPSDLAHEVADDAPSVYTHTRWKQFVDLAAYQEEPETSDEWPNDLTEAAAVALYQIAERLALAIIEDLTPDEDDNEEDEETEA